MAENIGIKCSYAQQVVGDLHKCTFYGICPKQLDWGFYNYCAIYLATDEEFDGLENKVIDEIRKEGE